MAWIIDVDHIADPDKPQPSNQNAKGMMGPRDYKGDGSELKYRFRMYDDDGNLYYTGRCSSWDDDDALGPLDNFGAPNAGAVRIDYQNPTTKQWEVLGY